MYYIIRDMKKNLPIPPIPATYDELKDAYIHLLHEIAWLKRQFFGQKTERYVALDNGQQVLKLGDAPAAVPAVETAHISYDRVVTPKQEEKNGHGRSPLPTHLPRVDVVIEPAEDVSGLKKIGEDITEEVDYKPGSLFVRRFIRPKYAKPDADGSTIVSGLLPYRPIDKGRPGPGLLAHVLISKFVDHLPLYRQERIFKREGLAIPRSTLCDWVEGCDNLLMPLYERLIERVLDTDYLQADETPVQVQDRLIPGKTHRGYFFVYHNPGEKAVFFDYRESRSRSGPMELLADYRGRLQVDGYAGYNEVLVLSGRIGVGCWAHVRRKFFEAKDSDPARAAVVLSFIGELYAVEALARENNWTADNRLEARQSKSVLVMAALKAWLDTECVKVLPKSVMGLAIAYALNFWMRLQVYLTDGALEIDNNLVENAIRPVALGRKNWLFAGSHDGARRAATIYSLLCTCAMNGMEPFEYLRNLLDVLPGFPQSRISELLPLKTA